MRTSTPRPAVTRSSRSGRRSAALHGARERDAQIERCGPWSKSKIRFGSSDDGLAVELLGGCEEQLRDQDFLTREADHRGRVAERIAVHQRGHAIAFAVPKSLAGAERGLEAPRVGLADHELAVVVLGFLGVVLDSRAPVIGQDVAGRGGIRGGEWQFPAGLVVGDDLERPDREG